MDLETGLILRELRCLKKTDKTFCSFRPKNVKKNIEYGMCEF